ncbi:hypothetical protein V2I01_00215 [Micromonospora sp. BRA006-A]|nr:hypothetical protein [Micromonospora sp. BRA006-A]
MGTTVARHLAGAVAAWLVVVAEAVAGYLGLLAYALVTGADPGGPLAGPLLVLIAALLGAALRRCCSRRPSRSVRRRDGGVPVRRSRTPGGPRWPPGTRRRRRSPRTCPAPGCRWWPGSRRCWPSRRRRPTRSPPAAWAGPPG